MTDTQICSWQRLHGCVWGRRRVRHHEFCWTSIPPRAAPKWRQEGEREISPRHPSCLLWELGAVGCSSINSQSNSPYHRTSSTRTTFPLPKHLLYHQWFVRLHPLILFNTLPQQDCLIRFSAVKVGMPCCGMVVIWYWLDAFFWWWFHLDTCQLLSNDCMEILLVSQIS